jgi:UDPglucose--hexose-1-phosphate uridylyltransferase
MAELRWNPILKEWVIVASERRNRPILPRESCPLCPGVLEIPNDYYIVSFENRFPALERRPKEPKIEGDKLYQLRRNQGVCEVLVYTSDHDLAPSELPLSLMQDLVEVWVDRFVELSKYHFVKYVFIFENRGELIGVTLSHPHGQIYAFPFIPPIIKRELESARSYFRQKGKCLFCEVIEKEKAHKKRIILENEHFIAFVPFFARFPYEIHLYPKEHMPDLLSLKPKLDHYGTFAVAIKTIIKKYDRLFNEPFPYMMVFHQAPTDGKDYSYYHFHVEFYSVKQGKDKIKYRAGVESGAGTFLLDLSPERMAKELKRVRIKLEE